MSITVPGGPGDAPNGGAERREAQERSITRRESDLSGREGAMGVREGVLGVREGVLGVREAAASEMESHSGDLREANKHLVMATLSAERLEEAAMATKRQQDEFLAMLAHELRNPLAPIRSAVAILKEFVTIDPRLKLIHEVVGRQVDQMARLLDDLLDASRVTSGKVTLQRRPIDVHEFVDQAVETCRTLIDTQRQQLTLDMPVGPIYVDGDPARLAQIIGNLLHNAAKYTPEGGAIALSARVVGDTVVLKVTDNGSGISVESLTKIFDLFTQEERALSRSQGGLGIGLTVVRTMVEQHGGTVSVRSEGLGTGSEFTVVLPRMDYTPEPVIAPVVALPVPSLRILLIDDNVDAGVMLSVLLEMSGHEVEIALDGPGALTSYARQRPQLVLCDIGLPGMSGYEVARRIRQEPCGEGRAPVLIALTGYDGPTDRARALAAGFDHHLAKPVDFEVLLALIGRVG